MDVKVRPGTIRKYADVLKHIENQCELLIPIDFKQLCKNSQLNSGIKSRLLKLEIIAATDIPDIYSYQGGKDHLATSRELTYEIGKYRTLRQQLHDAEEKEMKSLAEEVVSRTIANLDGPRMLYLNPQEAALLRIVFNNVHQDLQPFAERMLRDIA